MRRDQTRKLPSKSSATHRFTISGLHLLVSISVVAGNVQSSLLAELHLNDALVPAYIPVSYIHLPHYPSNIRHQQRLEHTLDDLPNTNLSLEGPFPFRRIKLLALLLGLAFCLQPAGVLHGDAVALVGGGARAFGYGGFLDAHCAEGGGEST